MAVVETMGNTSGHLECASTATKNDIPCYSASYMRHSTIDLSEESLRDSEPSDIFLLGTQAPRDRILHEV